MSKLVLIDGNAIIHRAYHALPKTLTSKDGEPINAVYGFVSMLLRIIDDLKPTHIAVCFDRKEPTFRKKMFDQYQAHRPEMDDELSAQFGLTKEVVDSFSIPIYEKAGFEADDVIGTLSKQGNSKTEVVIVTGDKDILQLVNDDKNVKVYIPVRGLSDAKLFGEREVVAKLGVKANQVVDYKALVGDPSDNYPGVKGIGPKTAEKLLEDYKTLENIYKNIDKIDGAVAKKLQEFEHDALMSQKLARIVTNVDVKANLKDASDWSVGNKKTLDVFKRIGFKTLTKRVKGERDFSINKKPSLEQIKKVVGKVAKSLAGKQYAIRGTASLVLQGLDMGVTDIDVLCDKKCALAANDLMKDYLMERVEYQESDKFKSYFGKFVIDEVLVEIIGDWQINGKKGWSGVYGASDEEITQVDVSGQRVSVTKPEVELEAVAAMGRWNELHKIKRELAKRDQRTLF